jgi:four helix bundle protein
MNASVLKDRTKHFALRILALVDALPNTIKGRAIAHQFVRDGTSVGANYRAACRSRSKAEFIAKLGTVIEETDECAFWMELISEGNLLKKDLVQDLWDEADQLAAIMPASRKTAENKRQSTESQRLTFGNRNSSFGTTLPP